MGSFYGHLPYLIPDDIINWPSNETVNPHLLSINELNSIFETIITLDITDECVKRLKLDHTKFHTNKVQFIHKIRGHILSLLKEISGSYRTTSVPWAKMKQTSFLWWPPGIEFKDPGLLSTDDLKIISQNIQRIAFTDEFKSEYLEYIHYIEKYQHRNAG